LRYPEKELVSVPARQIYAQPAKPFLSDEAGAPALSAQQQTTICSIWTMSWASGYLNPLHHNITIREGECHRGTGSDSRFAANPKWLIYLPPTMSPSETTREPGLLEHPLRPLRIIGTKAFPSRLRTKTHGLTRRGNSVSG